MTSTGRKIGYIYVLRCLGNGKVYVGQTSKKRPRKTQHLNDLRRGDHHSVFLQEDWNTFGETRFVFEIVEECPIEVITEREQWWVDFYAATVHGYNVKNPITQDAPSDRLSEAVKKTWEGDEDRRLVTSQARAKQWKDPKYQAERKAGTTSLWQDEEYRVKTQTAVKAGCNMPEYLAALRERTRQQHTNRRKERRSRLEAVLGRFAKFSHLERSSEEKARLAKERRSAGHLAYWANLPAEKKAERTAHLASDELQALATKGKRRRR